VWLDPRDDVAVAATTLEPGDSVELDGAPCVSVCEPIPAGHKVALRALDVGDLVHKWGEPIGRVTRPIQPGEHVHVHNLVSARLPQPTGDGTPADPTVPAP
jgi:hypothetical protein